MADDRRPNPDLLLASIQKGEAAARGRLKLLWARHKGWSNPRPCARTRRADYRQRV